MERKYYLATTGISEIWDLDKELLFLGPWCLLGENKRIAEGGRNCTVLTSPWKPTYRIKESAELCHHIYLHLLPKLCEQLNKLHGLNYPQRYWQVLAGPWLLHFIGIFYDRYMRLENAASLFPDFYTHVLKRPNPDLSSADTLDFFTNKAGDDGYNLILFSIIASRLFPGNTAKTDFYPKVKSLNKAGKNSLKAMAFNFLTRPLFSSGEVKLACMYHLSGADKLRFKMFDHNNKIGFIDFVADKEIGGASIEFNHGFRQGIVLKGARSPFEELLFAVIGNAIPRCYIEGYPLYKKYSSAVRGMAKAKAFGSTIGWDFNERFKFIAADAATKGVLTFNFQHGGGYGLLFSTPSETISLERDRFFTWGVESVKDKRARYLPSPHLSKIRDFYTGGDKRLLFIGTMVPKYHNRFSTYIQPDDVPAYLAGKKIFFDNLDASVRLNALYRPYREYGWDEWETIRRLYPQIRRLSDNENLIKWMRKMSMVVIDHPQTSFLEALTINVPTILYWDYDVNLMRDDSGGYFGLLKKAEILHETPLNAANKVNEVFGDSLAWWKSKDVQMARSAFCGKYARTDKDWVKIWIKALSDFGETG